jgi:hypothetical protein
MFRFLYIPILIFSLDCQGQVFLGLSTNEIIDSMRISYPNFSYIKNQNKSYNYLKFVDWDEDQTWLFIIVKGQCRMSRYIIERKKWRKTRKELHAKYVRINRNTWLDDNYVIHVRKQKWYFTIAIKKRHPSYQPEPNFIFRMYNFL